MTNLKQAGTWRTYITGSNMLRIFRHGVKLFGGEFLRSNGNAEKQDGNNSMLNVMPWESVTRWPHNVTGSLTFTLPYFGGHTAQLVTGHGGLEPPPDKEVSSPDPLCFCSDARLVG